LNFGLQDGVANIITLVKFCLLVQSFQFSNFGILHPLGWSPSQHYGANTEKTNTFHVLILKRGELTTATPSSLAPVNPGQFSFLVSPYPGCPGKAVKRL